MFGRIGDRIFPGADIPFAPGRDDFQARVKSHHRQLEAYLIIAFAGGTVGDGIRSHLMSNIHHVLGDQWASHGGAELIFVFVNCTGLQHRE